MIDCLKKQKNNNSFGVHDLSASPRVKMRKASGWRGGKEKREEGKEQKKKTVSRGNSVDAEWLSCLVSV